MAAFGTKIPYFMNNTIRNPKDENRRNPNVDCTMADLAKINVEYFQVNMNEEWESHLENFSNVYGMKTRDQVTISRTAMGSQFDIKMTEFFTEHLHEDAEVRFIKEGSGYFDFRSDKDQWIRIHVTAGDLIYLPAGIYHRFTTDRKEFTVAIRLFKENPRWTAIHRSEKSDSLPVRQSYLLESGIVRAERGNE